MPLDFARIKAVPITDILGRYGVRLRFNGEWGSAQCPLPTHKSSDTDKTFQVNTQQNYWKCWSASCNEHAGVKGGDVINFVALKEGVTQYEAASKIAEWFHLDAKKAAPHMEKRPENPQGKGKETQPQKDSLDNNESSGSVKGYMADVDAWFDELFRRGEKETDVDYWKRTRNGVKARLIQSYRNGQRKSQGLPAQ